MRQISRLIVILLLLMIGGCAAYRSDNLDRMQSLPQHYKQFDLKLAWDVKQVDDSTVIDGIVKNIRYVEVDDLEIWVLSLDAGGKVVHRAADFVYRLRKNETGQFTLKIPRLAPGSKLRFTYSYVGSDGGGDSGGVTWIQSFESQVP